MTPSWRTVCLGLRLILIGAQTIGWSLVAAFAIGCGGMALVSALKWNDTIGWVVLALLFTAIGIGVLGRLLCAVGRWFCMVTPPEAIRARPRIRLTVMFEACSLLSGAVTLGLVTFAAPLTPEFGRIGVIFWLLTTILSRVCFFSFVFVVSEDVQGRATAGDVRNVFRISPYVLVAIILGSILLGVGDQIRGDDTVIRLLRDFCFIVGVGLLLIAAACALVLFFGHFILITDLRRLLASSTPKPPEDDPDREYRERHLAAGGSPHDT